jgi:hypothetical protein
MTKARDLADLGNKTSLDEINDAYDAGALSNRNLIINGAMQVAQRGDNFNGGSSNAFYTVDRFVTAIGSSFNLDTTITQSTTVPSGEGFKYSLKVEADAVVSTTSGQNGGISQRLEAQDVYRLAYGTSSAKPLTLSFWVRSNKTGIYCVQLMTNVGNSDGAERYSHVKEYTISSANTWEKKTLTFSGHTGQVINSSANNDGLRINWWLASDALDNQIADTWSNTSAYGSTSNQVDFMDSASNEWYLTGVQLEVGDTATPFEHRSYGDELAKCQRYYEVLEGTGNNAILSYSHDGASTNNRAIVRYKVTKRSAPTIGWGTGTNPSNLFSGVDALEGYNNSVFYSNTAVTLDAEI